MKKKPKPVSSFARDTIKTNATIDGGGNDDNTTYERFIHFDLYLVQGNRKTPNFKYNKSKFICSKCYFYGFFPSRCFSLLFIVYIAFVVSFVAVLYLSFSLLRAVILFQSSHDLPSFGRCIEQHRRVGVNKCGDGIQVAKKKQYNNAHQIVGWC